jgi:ectoine hydroxylase-related dioxygenase (phytanoyl-CoA dioxygenase family)
VEETLQRLEQDGFVVFEDALDAERIARLVGAVDRVREERAPGASLHLLGFVGLDPEFVELVDEPPILELVARVLGTNIFMYHCHLDVHPRVAHEPAWRWHQDGGRQNVELRTPRPLLSVKIAYFLTDVERPDAGAMRVIPGSHRRDRLERPSNGSSSPEGAVPLLVQAGTAVIVDRRLWHARGDNVSGPVRKALFYAYTHRWIRPRDELLAVDEALLARLDPVRRQLLGAGTGPLGHWIPTDDDIPLAMRYKPPPGASTSSATWRASPGS